MFFKLLYMSINFFKNKYLILVIIFTYLSLFVKALFALRKALTGNSL